MASVSSCTLLQGKNKNLGSNQVRTFTSELLQEFDGNDNALVAKSVRKHNKADVGG